MKRLLAILSILFSSLWGNSCRAATSCDTLFPSTKLKMHYIRSLTSLEIDSSYDSEYFHDSTAAVFSSQRKDLRNLTVIAVRWKKGWKYWKMDGEVGMAEFGDVKFSHVDITGDGEPELFLWVFDYFSHHSAMEVNERKDYSVLVFDVAHSRELLDFSFRIYSSDLLVDLDGLTDSLGNPWPPDVDEYYPLRFYPGKLFVYDSSKVHAPVFPNEDAADSVARTRYLGAWTIDRCTDHSGVYELKNNSWVRTNDNTLPAEKPICPPTYSTWWEVPSWLIAPKDPPEH